MQFKDLQVGAHFTLNGFLIFQRIPLVKSMDQLLAPGDLFNALDSTTGSLRFFEQDIEVYPVNYGDPPDLSEQIKKEATKVKPTRIPSSGVTGKEFLKDSVERIERQIYGKDYRLVKFFEGSLAGVDKE